MQATEVHEVGFREVILTVQGYLRVLGRYWYVLLLGGLLVGGYKYYAAASEPLRYEAVINFLVTEENKGGNIGLGSIFGQIGIGAGGGGGQNLERVLAFSSSRRLMNHILLDSVEIEGKTDLLANHIIEVEDLEEEWDMVGAYGMTRLIHDSIPDFDKPERSILKGVYNHINYSENPLMYRKVGEKTGIISIHAETRNEELSFHLATALFAALSEFYTTESAGQSRASVERLQHRSDSLLQELTEAEYRLAGLYDTRLNLANRRDQVRQAQLTREVNMLSIAHAQVTANLETARFALGNLTPFFQVMDVPYLPLNRKRKQPIPNGLLGFGIGVFLAAVGLCVRHFFRSVMHSPDAG